MVRVLGITSSMATVFIYYHSAVDMHEAVTSPLAGLQAQGFGPASKLGPFGINWILENPQAGTAKVIQAGGGVLCLKLKGDVNNTFIKLPFNILKHYYKNTYRI